MLQMSPTHERLSHGQDRARASTLFERIEETLAAGREGEVFTVDALRNVRAMMKVEFSELKIIGKFVINDWVNFRDWSVRVEYPDGRRALITHEA